MSRAWAVNSELDRLRWLPPPEGTYTGPLPEEGLPPPVNRIPPEWPPPGWPRPHTVDFAIVCRVFLLELAETRAEVETLLAEIRELSG